MADWPYNTHAWRQVRKFVIRRDGRVCRIRLPGCTHVADTADHIVTVQAHGPAFDPLNLRAACSHCNSVRGNMTKKQARNGAGSDPAPLGPSQLW